MLPHVLLERLLRADITLRELKVALAIAQVTLHHKTPKHAIGLTELARMTMLERTHAGHAVRSLEAKGIVRRKFGGHIQELFLITQSVTEMGTLNGTKCDQIGHQSVTKSVPEVCPNRSPSYIEVKKKRETRNCAEGVLEGFDIFWRAYPKKKAKKDARKAFEKISPDAALLANILAALDRAKASRDWRKDAGQFVPYPATWLNGERWEDDTAPIAQQQPRLAL